MNSEQFLNELNLFPEREAGLKKVTRYSLYHTMFYRTNLWTHTRRVAWIVKETALLAQEVFGAEFDPEKAIALALVHDDAEIIFGDIQAGNKAKMSKEELAKVEQLERDAADDLVKRSPTHLGKYEYKTLLLEAVEKSSLESMVVSWADKYDAFCEALHELHAGNKLWAINVENEYGKIDLPTVYYMNYFNSFERKFSRSAELFSQGNEWFSIPPEPDFRKIVSDGSEHTKQSLSVSKNYPPYDRWIALTFRRGDEEDVANLHVRKEGQAEK